MTVTLDAESLCYPDDLLEECQSGLLLFCSGRMGSADGHWFAQHEIAEVTAVDWDEKTLEPFKALYPPHWTYEQADAFAWAESKAFGSSEAFQWDIVSADPPSQYRDRMVPALGLWCQLARKYVTATVMQEEFDAPDGWEVGDVIPRASYLDGREYYWAVLERE